MSAEEARDGADALLADALRLSVFVEKASSRAAAAQQVIARIMDTLLDLERRGASVKLSPEDASILANLLDDVRHRLAVLGKGAA